MLQFSVSAGTNSPVKVLLGSDRPDTPTTSGVQHGRSILVYESAGSGAFISPWCSTPTTGTAGRTPLSGSSFVMMHAAFVFDQVADSVTWYVNGIFNATRTGCGISNVDAGNLTLGGRLGETTSDVTTAKFAYVRAWSKALSASEVAALALGANSHFLNYTKPIVNTPYPYAAFNPTAGGSVSASAGASVALYPQYCVERLYPNGSSSIIEAGSASGATPDLEGNFSYRATFMTSLAPSGGYCAVSYDCNSILAYLATLPVYQSMNGVACRGDAGTMSSLTVMPATTTIRVWTGVAALSAVSTPMGAQVGMGYQGRNAPCSTGSLGCDQVMSDRFGGFARICYRVVWNRPVNWTFDSSGQITNSGITAASFLNAGSNSNISVTALSPTVNAVCVNAPALFPAGLWIFGIPQAPAAPFTDFNGVIPYGGPALGGAHTVVPGLFCNITVVSTDPSTATIVYNVSWNRDLYAPSFTPLTHLNCSNCVSWSAAQVSALAQVYQVSAVSRDTMQPTTLSLMQGSSATDSSSSYRWTKPVDVEYSTASYNFMIPPGPSSTATATASAGATPTATSTASAGSLYIPAPSAAAGNGITNGALAAAIIVPILVLALCAIAMRNRSDISVKMALCCARGSDDGDGSARGTRSSKELRNPGDFDDASSAPVIIVSADAYSTTRRALQSEGLKAKKPCHSDGLKLERNDDASVAGAPTTMTTDREADTSSSPSARDGFSLANPMGAKHAAHDRSTNNSAGGQR